MFNNEKGIQAALDLMQNRSFQDDELFARAIEEIKQGRLKIINGPAK